MEFLTLFSKPYPRINWRRYSLSLVVLAMLSLLSAGSLLADELKLIRDGETFELKGEILLEAQDESVLFQTNDGQLWIATAKEIQNKVDVDEEVESMSGRDIGKQLLKELPEGFKINDDSKPFVIAYQTEKSYARWVGGLYRQLHRGFDKYWIRKKFKLHDPDFPLVVIIFSTRAEYAKYVQKELGQDPGSMVAYYNLMTNRVAMYDLTEGQRPPGSQLKDDRRISAILSNPKAIPMVATVIHEGTHQLMCNCGMQTRFADTPLWLNEGMAMYFETPDLKSSKGWRTIGKVNSARLRDFQSILDHRQPNALETMLSSNKLLQNPQTATMAYAEAWAFNYFLLEKHSKEYVAYLKHLSTKKPMDSSSGEERVAEFLSFFDKDLNELDREFVQFARKLKP